MNIDVNVIIRDLVYIVITGLAVPLTTYLVNLCKVKIQEVTANQENETLNKYIKFVTDAVGNAVLTVNQTFVDSLKESGTFDEAAQVTAKEKAISIAKELITEDAKKAVEEAYGDFNAYLDSSVESMVRLNK